MIYKLTVWQYRISVFCTVMFLVLSVFWFILDCGRLEPLVVLFGGIAALTSLVWPVPNYGNKRLKGRDSFNYSSNNGIFTIGKDQLTFATKWSKASGESIHLYNDPVSIDVIALADNVTSFKEIRNADAFDFTSRTRTLKENEIAVLKNNNGYYALIRIVDVKDNSRSDDRDELTIEWIINPDKKTDFS
ncbi:hypothetical protein QZK53_07245 [Acinetobacter baumannii]|uniref:hypothetical protein n=1 Tax=Acinetobacter baumannii TaxID=470 RepID=UPI000DE6889A|nr:hypothetical protein [Acinetobacter baumannii]EKW3160505.1 hypothetical protein [Acinetobacter baumannii]MCG6604130.1 hypothetical protein [Acinetobacter baumannii]MDN8366549.1 hypothetical protein [Acinetobacter baumannii]SSW84756.1 Uncharacterised protein [Klebsiella pneumoniae]